MPPVPRARRGEHDVRVTDYMGPATSCDAVRHVLKSHQACHVGAGDFAKYRREGDHERVGESSGGKAHVQHVESELSSTYCAVNVGNHRSEPIRSDLLQSCSRQGSCSSS